MRCKVWGGAQLSHPTQGRHSYSKNTACEVPALKASVHSLIRHHIGPKETTPSTVDMGGSSRTGLPAILVL